MNDSPASETNLLISGCLNVAQTTGIPAQYLISHALLFATAVVGGSACYRTHADQAPQLIGTPATILSQEDVCPYWFGSATGETVDLQQRITARTGLKMPLGLKPAQVKEAKRLVKMHAPLQRIMPSFLQDAMIHGLPSMIPASFQFLHDIRKSPIRKGPPLSLYGPHLLAFAEGESCYRDLLGKRLRPDSIYAAAANPSPESRVTIHGWAEFSPIKNLLRRDGMEVIPALGFLLDVPTLKNRQFGMDDVSRLYSRFFKLILQRRINYPMYFLPGPEIVEILNIEVHGQAERARISGIPEAITNPRPMLPWNIATILWAIERDAHPNPENFTWLADKACRTARFIHELHIHTLRRIFPISKNGAIDPMDAAIMDKLSVEPLHLRQLMRRIHRIGAENLRIRLGFLEEEGVIGRVPAGDDRDSKEKWYVRSFPAEKFAEIALRLSAKEEKPPTCPTFEFMGTASLR